MPISRVRDPACRNRGVVGSPPWSWPPCPPSPCPPSPLPFPAGPLSGPSMSCRAGRGGRRARHRPSPRRRWPRRRPPPSRPRPGRRRELVLAGPGGDGQDELTSARRRRTRTDRTTPISCERQVELRVDHRADRRARVQPDRVPWSPSGRGNGRSRRGRPSPVDYRPCSRLPPPRWRTRQPRSPPPWPRSRPPSATRPVERSSSTCERSRDRPRRRSRPRFSLHPNVARHHLDRLVAGGYVRSRPAATATSTAPAGRPSGTYRSATTRRSSC